MTRAAEADRARPPLRTKSRSVARAGSTLLAPAARRRHATEDLPPPVASAAPHADAIGTAASRPHAMMHGLRTGRDEAQLTKVVGSIARTDLQFARGFASALI